MMQLIQGLELKVIREHPEYLEKAAEWFSGKWSVPKEAYLESMEECVKQKGSVPQWYIALDDENEIVAGVGIIENDFHDRKDLAPNLCGLFVEEDYRCRGAAGALLEFARRELGERGFGKAYLVTDHTAFYERYGWEFLTMVDADDGTEGRIYETSTLFTDVKAE